MRSAYIILGLAFLVVFGGAFLVFEKVEAPELIVNYNSNMSLSLTSPAFHNNETIPTKYTCDGENINPPLVIDGVPEGTKSLVLVIDDPDIPNAVKEARAIDKFDHWVIYNLDPGTKTIPANYTEATRGLNSRGEGAYTGPCPPPEYEPTTHRYIFRLYALSGTLNFIKKPTLNEVEEAAKGLLLDKAELIGIYDRSK